MRLICTSELSHSNVDLDVGHPDLFAVLHLLSKKYYFSSLIKRVYSKLSQINLEKMTLVNYGVGVRIIIIKYVKNLVGGCGMCFCVT